MPSLRPSLTGSAPYAPGIGKYCGRPFTWPAPRFRSWRPARRSGPSALLLVCSAIYVALEFQRLNGARLPRVRRLDKWVLRRDESRRAATAPLTLALGMLVALWCLPPRIAFPCILIAAVADSAASVIGARWGRVFWPHNRMKTLEGSIAFLISAVVCASVYLPLPGALLLAVTAAVLESLPLQDWDNFVTPVGSGLVAAALLGLA